MRLAGFAAIVALAACGRIGFDALGGDDADGGMPGPSGKITNPTAVAGEQFGHQVALSSDGRVLVVSARAADAGVTDGGAVYVFVPDGEAWVLEATLEPMVRDANDQFGVNIAVSLDGSTIVVSSTNEDSGGTDTTGDPNSDAVTDSGAAWVYARSGGVWTQQAYVKAGISTADDAFGSCVALSGTGDVLVVGSRNDDAAGGDAGSVTTYQRMGTTWAIDRRILAADARANDEMGTACALSKDGATVAVALASAVNERGEVIVAHDIGNDWDQSSLVPVASIAGDSFGDGLAISPSGTLIAAGANAFDGAGQNAGAVFVFERGATWQEVTTLVAPDAQADDNLGFNLVAVDDNTILVAAEGAERGGMSNAGAVYAFTRSGGSWSGTQMEAPAPVVNQIFGDAIAASDNGVVAIGAPGDDAGRGAVYVYRR